MNENSFEEFYGIDTHSIVEGKSDQDNFGYEPTEYEGLIKVFDHLEITPYDTLVDFGCGLGRVLFYCNQRFMCNVTGVEYDRDIYHKLTDNAEIYHKKFMNQKRKFSLLRMSAEEYQVEPTDNYFYFFNPFSANILKTVLDNIMTSYEKNKRKLTFIFYFCTYDTISTLRNYPFKVQEIIKLPNYENDPEEKAYIYYLE